MALAPMELTLWVMISFFPVAGKSKEASWKLQVEAGAPAAEQGWSPSLLPSGLLLLCVLGAARKGRPPCLHAVPRDAPLGEAHRSLLVQPLCLESAHPVGDPGGLGSPEHWETPCCFSPRLFPWLGSI